MNAQVIHSKERDAAAPSMKTSSSRPHDGFSGWLAGELRARKLSQRQLAKFAGLNPATISRLLRGERLPSLETVTKLMHALPGTSSDAQVRYLGRMTATTEPTTRVMEALASDALLGEGDVRQILNAYLELRRQGRQQT